MDLATEPELIGGTMISALDWASGFHAFEDQALDAEGEFLSWSALPESIQVKLRERLTPWLTRYE